MPVGALTFRSMNLFGLYHASGSRSSWAGCAESAGAGAAAAEDTALLLGVGIELAFELKSAVKICDRACCWPARWTDEIGTGCSHGSHLFYCDA